jgi:hypothetical protein
MIWAVVFFAILVRINFWNTDADPKLNIDRDEAGTVTKCLIVEGMEFALYSF